MQQQLFEKFAGLLSITNINSNFVVSHIANALQSFPSGLSLSHVFHVFSMLAVNFMTHTETDSSQVVHMKEHLREVKNLIMSKKNVVNFFKVLDSIV